jgi:hypothetical protein
MPIELNEMLRSEAEKMSEFIVNDTKRTVEMFNFLKQQREGGEMISEAIKTGVSIVGGLLAPKAPLAARLLINAVKDSKDIPVVDPTEELLKTTLEKLRQLRTEAEQNESLSCYFVDEKLHDIEVLIYDHLNKKGQS